MLDEKRPETQVGIIQPFPLCFHALVCSWWPLLSDSVSFPAAPSECEETLHMIISSLSSPLCKDEWVFCLWNSNGGDFCYFFFLLTCSSSRPPPMSHFKPCSKEEETCQYVWVTRVRWELDVWSEVTGNGCLCSPIGTQGITKWSIKFKCSDSLSPWAKDYRKHRCAVYWAGGFLYSLLLKK